MRSLALGLAVCAGVLAAAPHAQDRAGLPTSAARAVPDDNALIFTQQNEINISTNWCATPGRVYRLRDVTDTGWEQGPSVAGLTLDIPAAVTLDANRRLYIADRENRRVVRMDDIAGRGWTAFGGTGGNLLANPGTRTSCVASNSGVHGVVLDAAGRIYISASNPQRLIRVNDMSGAGWTTFELPGGDYFSARFIARDARGRIYLADNAKHRIIRIDDISGAGRVMYGSLGNGPGQFNQPFGIAFDARGRIYIGDEYNHRIVRMDDMSGNGWTTYGGYGGGAGQLSEPHGVEVDRLGRIYIADTGNRRIVRIDDMNGAGEVSFGYLELQGRGIINSAVKSMFVVGDGPTIADLSIFPFVAVGGPYRTSIVAVNTGRSATDAELALTAVTGTCPSCAGTLPVTVDDTTDSSFVRTVAAMGSTRLDASVEGPARTGYARLRASANVPGVTVVQAVDGETITGEAAWGPTPGMDHFTIYVDNTGGARTTYTLTNPRSEDRQPSEANGVEGGWTNVTFRLRNKAGAIIATQSTPMGRGYQISEDVSARFPQAGPGFEGTLEILPIALSKIQATAVRYDNGESSVFTMLPVFTHPEHPNRQSASVGAGYIVPRGPTTIHHPIVADGGTYQTNFILFNPGDVATTATVEFFAASGAPLAIEIAGDFRTRLTVSLQARAVEHVLSAGAANEVAWGWARITAPLPVRGQAILQTRVEGRITAATAVPAADPMRRFATVVTNSRTTQSAVAVGNPNAMEVRAIVRLRDTTGMPVGEVAILIPGRGRLAQFVTQLFPAFGEFEGTLEVEASGSGLLTGVGLRYDNPDGTIFTTLPVFRLP